jgi:hypothetical protein
MLTLCALPALGRVPLREGETPVVAIADLPSPGAQQKLDSLFYRWDSYELDLPAIERQARENGRLKLQVGGRLFDLELQPNDLRAPGFTTVRQTRRGAVKEKPSPVATFQGHVSEDPESIVRLLIMKDFLQGYIRTQDEWIFIDPLLKYSKGVAPSKVVVFDEDDVRPEAGTLCGASELAHRAHDLSIHPVDAPSSSGTEKALIPAPTLGRVDLATEADYEYYSRYGYNTNNQILGIINQVDGIYRGELALNLQVIYQNVWTVPDPYNGTTANDLLNSFTNYWNNNRRTVARDLAHLFTGKNLGGEYGRTHVGWTCINPGLSYGLSRDHSLLFKITAHEIGHNFNARHDDEVNPPGAICNGSGPLMCAAIQTGPNSSFSDRSKTDITTFVNNNGSCLDRLATTYYTILTNQTPDTAGAGTGYEAGNQFSSSQDGYITALRFWKAPGETGTHVGRLWTNSGVQLASVTFQNETASGWQEQYLPFRVRITAGTLYWVTYNENAWQSKAYCGLSSPITNGPLTAWRGAYSNANSPGTFPTNGSCSNFFADVYFTP